MRRPTTIGCCIALTLVASAGLLVAGPLTPPAGPVASSYKTLSEVEPRVALSAANTPGDSVSVYKITQPGSYYLTENLYCPASHYGVAITGYNVTLDLNGFAIIGAAGSNSGITISTGQTCTVRNGHIRGFNTWGLYSSCPGSTFEGLSLANNNGGGLFASNDSVLANCVAQDNNGPGFTTSQGCRLHACTASSNGSTINDAGFELGDSNAADHCTALGNFGPGFYLGHNGSATDCTADGNNIGIQTFDTGKVRACVCDQNTSDGIRLGTSSTARENSCAYNGDDGIQAVDGCVIVGNSCQANGPAAAGAGVYILGTDCRIEDNHVVYNHYGVLIGNGFPANLVVRNTAKDNNGGNYAYPAGTNLAPIVNPGATFSGATPWSNFSY